MKIKLSHDFFVNGARMRKGIHEVDVLLFDQLPGLCEVWTKDGYTKRRDLEKAPAEPKPEKAKDEVAI